VGDNRHINLGDVVELSNGKYVAIGQSVYGGVAISSINNDGSDFKYTELTQEYYYSGSIASGMNGTVYGLFKASYPYPSPLPLTFMAFNSNLILTHQSYLLDFKESVSSGGLVRNDDGSFTLLINEGHDIIVTKRDME
jgi:hypothetical protein